MAQARLDRRRAADTAVEDGVVGRLRLGRIFPQHAAAGAAVSLVLRFAGTTAAIVGTLAEADSQRAALHDGDRGRTVHVSARGRTVAGRHRLAAARTKTGRDPAW